MPDSGIDDPATADRRIKLAVEETIWRKIRIPKGKPAWCEKHRRYYTKLGPGYIWWCLGPIDPAEKGR